MSEEYISFGESIVQLTEDALTIPISRRIFRACVKHKFFKLVELRCFVKEGKRVAEMLVVDCTNDSVPTKNVIGILYQAIVRTVFEGRHGQKSYSSSRVQIEQNAHRMNSPMAIVQTLLEKVGGFANRNRSSSSPCSVPSSSSAARSTSPTSAVTAI